MPMSLRDLSRDRVLHFIDHPDEARAIAGSYVCFLMIPITERIGQWRFAGTATDFGGALSRLGELSLRLGQKADDPLAALRPLCEDGPVAFGGDKYRERWSLSMLETAELGAHEIVVFGEGQAPYDDVGVCIFEVPDLSGHPFAARPIEDHIPKAWSGGDPDEDLDDEDLDDEDLD